ncbi:MAG: RNA methyltransferase [Deltaproteobacteria bacterium]|nr:RNA methyltransferase [Deltaproteobacteria bacterium]
MADIYLALIHYPVYDKGHKVVTTSITNMDIHDIARSALTYGVKRYFVVTPVRTLQALAEKILDHWQHGYGSVYNETRKDALALVTLADTLNNTIQAIQQETGERPRLVATSARDGDRRVSFTQMQRRIAEEGPPLLFLLGTGWGLTEEVLEQVDDILEPIRGVGTYNHLSVRSAAAILLDRLRGAR